MNDKTILDHISALVDEERQLRSAPNTAEQNHARLSHVAEQLDQCWDLLRQRRALREFGGDPSQAHARDADTVKKYIG